MERIVIKRPNAKSLFVIEYDRNNIHIRNVQIKILNNELENRLLDIEMIMNGQRETSSFYSLYDLNKEKEDIEYIMKILRVFIDVSNESKNVIILNFGEEDEIYDEYVMEYEYEKDENRTKLLERDDQENEERENDQNDEENN